MIGISETMFYNSTLSIELVHASSSYSQKYILNFECRFI
ncbi:hypothetical protein LEP1GSC059_0442 [Leptospira noguchii serovar Panama str. CZ214]|uniref:Uncharacterized protein n=1 Tax=Leptospira noguchii serovar Panama str. CZ214 TaxID=1001595 RepID=T0FJ16_9LEPT|nr:hypothetical protein LEP1GSC059_0442 [Leptospira noguchii serovar Panama str. CZ214]